MDNITCTMVRGKWIYLLKQTSQIFCRSDVSVYHFQPMWSLAYDKGIWLKKVSASVIISFDNQSYPPTMDWPTHSLSWFTRRAICLWKSGQLPRNTSRHINILTTKVCWIYNPLHIWHITTNHKPNLKLTDNNSTKNPHKPQKRLCVKNLRLW